MQNIGSPTKLALLLVSDQQKVFSEVTACEALLGRLNNMKAILLESSNALDLLRSKLTHAINEYKNYPGIVMLTDLMGSTQFRLCQSEVKPKKVALISGYNFPLLIKLLGLKLNENIPLESALNHAIQYAQNNIRLAEIKKAENTQSDQPKQN